VKFWTARVRHAQVNDRLCGIRRCLYPNGMRPRHRAELDPEGCIERSFLERWLAHTGELEARVGRPRNRLIARDYDGTASLWRGDTAPTVLSQKCHAALSLGVAATTNQLRGVARVFSIMATACSSAWAAPGLAHQRGVLPSCQQKHEREESCAEHVILAGSNGKNEARDKSAAAPTSPRVPLDASNDVGDRCGNSQTGAEKFRNRLRNSVESQPVQRMRELQL
jgi:hypothetical protein